MGVTSFAVGSLVKFRNRDWVVVPSEEEDVVRLRPLYGAEEEGAGVYLPLEQNALSPTSFPLPDPSTAGDFISAGLLWDAARLALRSGAGPFRSLGHLAVEPRPFQVVPLIMALRLDPVRLLIADDVGVGKTIEAALIARELLDRGEAKRLCVLAPPHLCEQWQQELSSKFNIEAKILRTDTISRLEAERMRGDISVYGYYRHFVASIDFVKSDRRRDAFLADAADLFIIDEAHGAARPGGAAQREQQQRYRLVKELSEDPRRHIILVTATPHSGIEESFLSLLGILNPRFEGFSLDRMTEQQRVELARHFVQRRRADVQRWLGVNTPFPVRKSFEAPYDLNPEYANLFNDVYNFTRRLVTEPGVSVPHRQMRYWAALALLRTLMSSPASAQMALTKKAALPSPVVAEEDLPDWERERQAEVMDPIREEGVRDIVPEAFADDALSAKKREVLDFLRRAAALDGLQKDNKLRRAVEITGDLLKRGYRPIIYCRYIETARYVAAKLKEALGGIFPDLAVQAVTGEMADEEREAHVAQLAEYEKRVLVATDCLSEGINLQEHFDAVIHYDLPWNPNRLEQREGRIDRYGQPRPEVETYLLYGTNNVIDVVVMRVLIRKAREIYRSLGVTVPVPVDSENIMQAILKELFERGDLSGSGREVQLRFSFADDLSVSWDRAAEREKVSRTRFAQHAIKPEEVARELQESEQVLGNTETLRRFVLNACQRLGIPLRSQNGHYVLDRLEAAPEAIKERFKNLRFTFEPPAPERVEVLTRYHPFVSALADLILGQAFAAAPDTRVTRAAAIYTNAVSQRMALILLRLRYRIVERRGKDLFAEEVVLAGLSREGGQWRFSEPNDEKLLALLGEITPAGNISKEERQERISYFLRVLQEAKLGLAELASKRARVLQESHQRHRKLSGGPGAVVVQPYDPDLLALYVLIPGGK